MRRLTVLVLALGLTACGGGGGSKTSGVSGSKPLANVSESEIAKLCDWAENKTYQPSEQEFCTAIAVENSDDSEECKEIVSECVADSPELSGRCGLDADAVAGCGATVSQFEKCVREAASQNRQYFRSASCSDLSFEEGPSSDACDALLSKCPWLDGSSDNPNVVGDDDDFNGDDDLGGDDFGDGGFVCDDGTDIDDFFLCDGSDDCWNGEDELDCEFGPDEEPPFTCDDGGTTSVDYVCDGEEDCLDGSDEHNCDGGFVCNDGIDVYDYVKCDGASDCSGGEDEVGCTDPNVYVCSSGFEISKDALCDGKVDCAGTGDDETDCPDLEPDPDVDPDSFSCSDGESIPDSYVCDGEPDCVGGEDESGCL